MALAVEHDCRNDDPHAGEGRDVDQVVVALHDNHPSSLRDCSIAIPTPSNRLTKTITVRANLAVSRSALTTNHSSGANRARRTPTSRKASPSISAVVLRAMSPPQGISKVGRGSVAAVPFPREDVPNSG